MSTTSIAATVYQKVLKLEKEFERLEKRLAALEEKIAKLKS